MSTPDSVEYTDLLLNLMEQRLSLLRAILPLVEQQKRAIHSEDSAALLGILGRKQPLIEELSQLQLQLAPYIHDNAEARVWKDEATRAQCRQVTQLATQLFKTILDLEATTLEDATTRRDCLQAQLQDGQDSILAHSAYNAESVLTQSSLDLGEA
ncbi:MAG: flagellar export chaperone FlgN [Planctomycetales bacterium]|nr:flagellar export chaperone FlgN [Planctomycetales bacterium]